MKCLLTGLNARVLAKAIQSLSRIGDELFLEAIPSGGLSVVTINSSKSAYASFVFSNSFFINFIRNDAGVDAGDGNKCRISMKSVLSVFKNMKQVEECKIVLKGKESRLVFKMKCRLDTTKTHFVSIIDGTKIETAYPTDNSPNLIMASHKVFTDIVANFQTNEEEITFEAKSSNLVAKNYVEGAHIDKRLMRTQYNLKPNEFETYRIGEEGAITFCLRELRALLHFAEYINLNVCLNFDSAGRPAVFTLKNLEEEFHVNLIMSTLSPRDVDVTMNNAQTSMVEFRGNQTTIKTTAKRKTKVDDCQRNTKKNKNSEIIDLDSDDLFNFDNCSTQSSMGRVRQHEPQIETPVLLNNPPNQSFSNSSSSSIFQLRKNVEKQPPTTVQPVPLDSEEIQVIFQEDSEDVEGMDFEESIPASPEPVLTEKQQRRKNLFRRCFEPTMYPQMLPGASQILQYNSDEEK